MKSDELKEAMKESPRRYTNPFLSDEENEKVNLWNNQELEGLNIDDDKLGNSLLKSDFCEKEINFYTDKNVMECELPELLVCYKDGAFHVKDICVDDGIPHGEMILFDENNNEMIKPERLKDYYMESSLCSGTNGNILEPSNDHTTTGNISIDTEVSVQDLQNLIRENDYKECGTKDSNELKNISKDDSDDVDECSENAPGKLKDSTESDAVFKDTDNYGPDILVQNGEEQINKIDDLLDNAAIEPCQNLLEEISKSPVVETTNILNESITEGTDTLNLINSEPAPDQVGAPNHQGAGSDNVATVNHLVHRGEGESSFSAAGAGHVSGGHITNSGPIGFSGSISLRSDSSTTSTRSFAFPILQNEWNSSPVRMAKADQRRLQKHRGWRHGLLCCRF